MSVTIAAARSSVYRLLADLYARELSCEQLSSFINGNGQKLLGALDTVPECAAIVAHLNRSFSSIDDPQQAVLDFAESYAWNFHGAGGPHSSPPYASVYLGSNKATHQEIEQEIRAVLQQSGLTLGSVAQEPFDHLSVILEFIAWLDEKESTEPRLAVSNVNRRDVMKKYLLSWLPAFSSRCEKSDRLGFYSGLTLATLAFVKADYAHCELQTPEGMSF